jgi:hypothetical protein
LKSQNPFFPHHKWTPSNAPGVSDGVSKTMRVITFLRVDFRPALITSLSVPVVASRGVGNVVRSFVLLTSIPKRVIRILTLKNHTTPSAVKRRKGSNRKSTAAADIIAIVRNGGDQLQAGKAIGLGISSA